jgi:hypothetical protein
MARKQIIQPALGLEGLKKQAAKIKLQGQETARVQQGFINQHSLNAIVGNEGDRIEHGVQAYFLKVKNLTINYMESMKDPRKLSLKGQQSLRRSSNR